MSLNLAVGNDECIVLVILLAVSRAVLKSYGGGGVGAHQTQDARKALSKQGLQCFFFAELGSCYTT